MPSPDTRLAKRLLGNAPAAPVLSAGVGLPVRGGRSVVDLAQGEVEDIATPDHVKEAARRALQGNRTKYTPTGGVPELREAIAAHFRRDTGLDVDASQVMASAGAKQCVFNFMMAVLNPGDEVLVPSPYWGSYPHQVRLAGGHPRIVAVAPECGFKVNAEALRRCLSSRTRVLILNNPNNPSGAVYTRRELEEILEVALSAGLLVLSDEVYHRLTYDGTRHTCFAALSPEAARTTVTVDALSKTYCMTGWRLGFAAGPRDLIAAMEQVQSHTTSCPNSFTQWAARAALEGDQAFVARLRDEMDARRRFVISTLREIPAFEFSPPSGGLYVFPSVTAPLRRPAGERDGSAFATRLLEATGVLVAPGDAFGVPDHFRICFGASHAALEAGLTRLSEWTRDLLRDQR